NVTTAVGIGWPSFDFCWSILVPAASTCTLLTTARDIVSFSARTVTMTSTRVPGTVKPATPMTSLTRTAIARMPGGLVGGSPAPDSGGASLFSVIGSFSTIDAVTPRPTTSSSLEKPPGTGESAGQPTSLTCSLLSIVPTGTDSLATTMYLAAMGTSRT